MSQTTSTAGDAATSDATAIATACHAPDASATPTGTWNGSVGHDGQLDRYTAVLHADGTLSMSSPRSEGDGTWEATGPDTFRFSVKEVFHPDAGMPAAYVQIRIEAQWAGASFTGKGLATIHAADGTQIYQTEAETTAERVA